MDNRKIIIASYVAVSFVAWFLTRESLKFIYAASYQIKKLPHFQLISEIAPVVVAAGLFFFLVSSRKIGGFLDEVVIELKKVTWPTREDVVKSTVVVLGCVLFASGILAVFDIVFGKVISYLLHSL